MLSNDFVRKCEGLTPAAPPEKMPAPRAAATAAVGDAVAVVDAGDSGGFQFGFSVELVWLVRLRRLRALVRRGRGVLVD
jgi:hypothetical protein